MITSLAIARERYKELLAGEGSSFWSKPPHLQVHVLTAWLGVLKAKPGDDGYDISSDTTFKWTE